MGALHDAGWRQTAPGSGAARYDASVSGRTTKVTVELPVEAVSALRRSPEELGPEMRVAAAIHGYTQDRLSMEKAAMIAGLNRRDFMLEMARRGVEVFEVDHEDLERELGRG